MNAYANLAANTLKLAVVTPNVSDATATGFHASTGHEPVHALTSFIVIITRGMRQRRTRSKSAQRETRCIVHVVVTRAGPFFYGR